MSLVLVGWLAVTILLMKLVASLAHASIIVGDSLHSVTMHFLTLLPLLATSASALAFPGAEGFGSNAVGGRNGTVYVVTNLNDSGPGSLRDAVSQPNRIVVFSTGGLITIKERMVVSKRVSILGQTAPGDGITVYGNGWSFSNANDAIVRYLRIRMGKTGTSGKDAITISEGSNMILDHVSVSWGRDETFSISGPDVGNITIQNSIIAQGLQTHSCGGLLQTELGSGISVLRNLYIDNKTRNPKVKGTNDFTNNVVYNWGGGGAYIAGDSEAPSEANIVGNYFVAGPSSGSVAPFTRGNALFKGFVQGNFFDSDLNGKLDGKEIAVQSKDYGGMNIQPERFKYPAPGKVMAAGDALAFVAKSAGASRVRDGVDERLVAELSSFGKMGELVSDEGAGPGVISKGTQWVDGNGNGIPDDVEAQFTDVEAWANSLVPSTY
ncbi:pectate lyase c [Pyrenophora seminiperda CCB06]|uniref:Pectate lyase c n=1 Tax=Pyrenophora seminiperda CCB06 TaxID=1302712 RepID=A0A3M7MG18_9PLEO|nr:pectate lyase c [Pyrenophora seminiperda CCB06]